MIKIILKDILKAGYEYRIQALVVGEIGFLICMICKAANICFGRKRVYRTWHLYGQILYQSIFFSIICMYFTYVIAVTLSGREAGSRVGYVNAWLFETLFVDGAVRIEALENLLLLMPSGLLMPGFFRWIRTWKRMGFFALFFSFSIEFTQLKTGRGYFQIDDILLNVLGALCGYFLYKAFDFLVSRIAGKTKECC